MTCTVTSMQLGGYLLSSGIVTVQMWHGMSSIGLEGPKQCVFAIATATLLASGG